MLSATVRPQCSRKSGQPVTSGHSEDRLHGCAGSRLLVHENIYDDVVNGVADIANTILLKSGDMKSMKEAQSDHRNIIAALELRDSKLAELQMIVHIESIRRSMRRLVFSHG